MMPTVLVIDDDEDVLDLVRTRLEEEGYGVVVAANGRQGLEAVAATMPDLILLDMKMPVMDGPSFAAEFRRLHGAAAPIVVVTAAEDARKCAQEVGAEGWLSKPFEFADLMSIVADHAREQR